jgi:ATP adenylyltransferase
MSYIQSGTEDRKPVGNIFTVLPAENEDERNGVLFRGEHAFIILNAYPYTNGHLMIAPFRETNDITSLSDGELLEINQLVAKAVKAIQEVYRPDGFNIGVNIGSAAGAGIPQHLHWHVLPRWNGDTNFMMTVGNTRVMPQTLEESYRRLQAVL